MTEIKVSPGVKRAFDRLKLENADLKRRLAAAENEIRVLSGGPDRPGPIVTTQQTAKKWKAFSAVGVMVMLVGFVGFAIGFANQPNADGTIAAGVGLFCLGLGSYVVGRVGKFWFHE